MRKLHGLNHIDYIRKLASSRIADARRSAGLTQSQLAEGIDVDQGTVARWEGGKSWPNSTEFCAMATFLGVNETFFFSDSVATKYPPPSDEAILAMLAERLKKPEKVQGREPNILDRLDAKKQLFYTQLIQDMESGDVAALEKELAEFLEKEHEK